MKKIFIALLILLTSCSQVHTQKKAKDEFILNGKIKGKISGLMLLKYINKNSVLTIDSSVLKNGKFTFKGSINQPTVAVLVGNTKSLTTKLESQESTRIFLESKRMSIILRPHHFRQAKVSGSYSQEQIDSLQKPLKPVMDTLYLLREQRDKLILARERGDTSTKSREKLIAVENKMGSYLDKMQKIFCGFIATHPNSYVSSWLLGYVAHQMPGDSAWIYYSKLSTRIKNSRYSKEAYEFLQSKFIGRDETLFELKESHGQLLKLSSLLGKKYVLLDFWASSFKTCIKSLPELKEIYKHYQSKGLEIISLSIGKDKKNWLEVLKKEKLNWPNIFLTGNRDYHLLASNYGLSEGIPLFILINKKGRIIGRYDGYPATGLKKKLHKIFD